MFKAFEIGDLVTGDLVEPKNYIELQEAPQAFSCHCPWHDKTKYFIFGNPGIGIVVDMCFDWVEIFWSKEKKTGKYPIDFYFRKLLRKI